MIGVLVKTIVCWILARAVLNVIKYVKIDEYLEIKSCSFKKCLLGKLALACDYETLNTTEISLDDKK